MGHKILDVKADIHEDVEAYFNERPDHGFLTLTKMEQIKTEVLDIVDKHFEKIGR